MTEIKRFTPEPSETPLPGRHQVPQAPIFPQHPAWSLCHSVYQMNGVFNQLERINFLIDY